MFTYIIQGVAHSPVKIGRAADVVDRLSSLQTGHPDELRLLLVLEGDREAELHQRFAEDRIRGEWFRWSKPIEDFVSKRFEGRPSVWHMVNCYCTEQQRQEFNDWHTDMYLAADAIRDRIRYWSHCHEIEIPKEMEDLINLICEVPVLLGN